MAMGSIVTYRRRVEKLIMAKIALQSARKSISDATIHASSIADSVLYWSIDNALEDVCTEIVKCEEIILEYEEQGREFRD